MTTHKAQQKGGRVTATKLRQAALDRYYQSPNICQQCKKIIDVKDNEKVQFVRVRKFCSQSCSTIHRNKTIKRKSKNETSICLKCNAIVYNKRLSSGGYYKRSYCDKCCRYSKRSSITSLTKKELFTKRKNWQSARSSVQRNAREVFLKSNLPKKCKICNYDHHIEISHIRSVSDFPDDVLISTINDISNLIALCPNHHWEYDNGILKFGCQLPPKLTVHS